MTLPNTAKLFLVCPTDNIELSINSNFKGRNSFISSLGNTLSPKRSDLAEIAKLINEQDIQEITLVLSEDNKIVLDALNNQEYIEIRGLLNAYTNIVNHKRDAKISWQTYDQQAMIISYHLNKKIKELRDSLNHHYSFQGKISGKIFSKHYNSFREIYSPLACINANNLN